MHQIRSPSWWDGAHFPFSNPLPRCWPFEPRTQHTHILVPGAAFVKHYELTLSPPIPLTHYTVPYWSNPPFLIFDIWALWRSGLLRTAAFGTAGVERVKCAELCDAPPSNISCSRLSTLTAPQDMASCSSSTSCRVMLCKLGSIRRISPNRPRDSYWRSLT